ncbi:hypothetical protein GCM10023324_42150 [Streptomyces youssoufiensis]
MTARYGCAIPVGMAGVRLARVNRLRESPTAVVWRRRATGVRAEAAGTRRERQSVSLPGRDDQAAERRALGPVTALPTGVLRADAASVRSGVARGVRDRSGRR